MNLLTKKQYEIKKAEILSKEYNECRELFDKLPEEKKLQMNNGKNIPFVRSKPKTITPEGINGKNICDILDFAGSFINKNWRDWSLGNHSFEDGILRMLIMREYNKPGTLMSCTYFFEKCKMNEEEFKILLFLNSSLFDYSFRTYTKNNIDWLFDNYQKNMFDKIMDIVEQNKNDEVSKSLFIMFKSWVTKEEKENINQKNYKKKYLLDVLDKGSVHFGTLCKLNGNIPSYINMKFNPPINLSDDDKDK